MSDINIIYGNPIGSIATPGSGGGTVVNTLKGSAEGTGVSLKDISPVKHDVPIQLSGLPPIEEAGTIIPIPTPYAFEDDAAQTGMTWTVAEDGTITIDVDGTKTDGTSPWFIAENLVLPAGEYVISVMKSVTVTPEINGGMWAHSMHICDGDMYYGSGNTIKIVELPTDTSTYMPDVSFTLTKETAIWIDYMYGSAGVGINGVPDRVVTEIKIELKSDVSYIPADYSGVKVQRLGKNLCNTGTATFTRGITIELPTPLPAKTPFVFSSIFESDYTGSSNLIQFNYTDGTSCSNADMASWNTKKPTERQLCTRANGLPKDLKSISFYAGYGWGNSGGYTGTLTNVQLEIGSTATEYEPYIEPIKYTANADGTVEGIKSLYPNMTLLTDTEGVIVTAEYDRDINKAIAALEAAILNV